jgi:hypothetical protein
LPFWLSPSAIDWRGATVSNQQRRCPLTRRFYIYHPSVLTSYARAESSAKRPPKKHVMEVEYGSAEPPAEAGGGQRTKTLMNGEIGEISLDY